MTPGIATRAAVDWTQVAGAGIDFAFARVGDGLTNRDAQFAANWNGMRASGITRVLYQYLRIRRLRDAGDLILQQLTPTALASTLRSRASAMV